MGAPEPIGTGTPTISIRDLCVSPNLKPPFHLAHVGRVHMPTEVNGGPVGCSKRGTALGVFIWNSKHNFPQKHCCAILLGKRYY